ncbi:MAG: TatD family hydrolase [Bacteroidota bacterium]
MIDTHTHLYLNHFKEDSNEVIQRAIEVGVKKFYLPSISKKYFNSMNELENEYPGLVYSMIGLHPCYVNDNYKEELEFVKNKLTERKFKAIGEIGIDLFHEKKYLNQQIEAFELQIELALINNLPIVIHSRDSFDEIFEILEKYKKEDLRGIFHCFTGDYDQAMKIIDLNFYLGIGGVVTFKNGKISEFLNKLPIQNIVLETDSPYLAPAPFRGKRNESSYLKIIAEKIADIYNLSFEEISKITEKNSMKIFGN